MAPDRDTPSRATRLAAIQVAYQQHLEARRALHNTPHDHELAEQVEEDHERHVHELEVAWWNQQAA